MDFKPSRSAAVKNLNNFLNNGLLNYSKLRKNLNNNELNSIKVIDLIDSQKAIIQFK